MTPAAKPASVVHVLAEPRVGAPAANLGSDPRSGQYSHWPGGRPHSGVEREYRRSRPDPSNLACRDRSRRPAATGPPPATKLHAKPFPGSGPPRCQTPDSRLGAHCHRGLPPAARRPTPQLHLRSSAQSPAAPPTKPGLMGTAPRNAPEFRVHRPKGFALDCSNQGPPKTA